MSAEPPPPASAPFNRPLRSVHLKTLTFLTGTATEISSHISSLVGNKKLAGSVRLVNMHTLANVAEDPAYAAVIEGHGINLIDSTPLSWLMRITSRTMVSAARGPDVFRATLDQGRSIGLRHFFLGGTENSLDDLLNRVSADYPGIKIAGCYAPPFRSMSAEEVKIQDSMIRQAGADIVWIGLGGTKQDFEAQRLSRSLGLTTVGVGAAFDFISGMKPEAPKWLRHSGLEWAHRFATEPTRLAKRYSVGSYRALRWILR